VSDQWLRQLLEAVGEGTLSPDAALERLADFPSEALDFATVDHLRAVTQGFPEVVLCEGKSVAQTLSICRAIHARAGGFLATRADAQTQAALREAFPAAEVNEVAGTVHHQVAEASEQPPRLGPVVIVSAGTSDAAVAEEAAVVARAMGNAVETVHDVGVAGIHRILERSSVLRGAAVIIVVAGMDGALASVVGGLVRVPVIAVPTSVGYGAAFGGVSALLAMLNSCASGVTVVNIDNGFGAAVAATRITTGDANGRHEP
jgi:NCAIR mutase (PurE)-related protein